MMLEPEAIASAAGCPAGRRLLQAGALPHLRRRPRALRHGSAGRRGHRGRRAAAQRPARDRRRRPGAARHHGVHAGHDERRRLRPHHRGARPAAPAHRGGGRDRRDRLRHARRRHQGARPRRVDGLRRQPAPGHRHDVEDRGPARPQPRPARAALRPGRRHHRRAHRLRRPRRAAVGPAAQQPGHRRCPAGHGQVRRLRHADRRPGDR